MEQERPKKINCPVPGCHFKNANRKRILQHMRGEQHLIDLKPGKSGPQGGNESLRRKKHTRRYARWLEAHGFPIDVSFFTDVEDELKSVEGWETVDLSEDDESADQVMHASERGEGEGDRNSKDDREDASSHESDLPLIDPQWRRRRRTVIEDDEHEQGDRIGQHDPSTIDRDWVYDSRWSVRDPNFPDAAETTRRPVGWEARDEEDSSNTVSMQQPDKFKCPVPGCKTERQVRRKILEHLRRKHDIPLSVRTKGMHGWKALRRQHAQEHATWLEMKRHESDLSFFAVHESEVETTPVVEEDQEDVMRRGLSNDGAAQSANLAKLGSGSRNAVNGFHSLKIQDNQAGDGEADNAVLYDDYDAAYMRLLRERLELFCEEDDQPTDLEFDVEHVAILICSVDDTAIDRWEEFCEGKRRWTEYDVDWMKTYVFKIVAQWRGAPGGRHVIDELISQFTSCSEARIGLTEM